MPRLSSPSYRDASGPAAEIFSQIKKSIGSVPNVYAVIGSNSPHALKALLSLNASISASSLPKPDIEVINLAVSQYSGCEYCIAAHTVLGAHAGLSKEDMLGARHGGYGLDPKLQALADFVRAVLSSKGTIDAGVIQTVKSTGYSDQQIVDALLVVAGITFTNSLNRVNDTPVDFPSPN